MPRHLAGTTEALKRQFGIWLGMPPESREETQVQLAKKLGVNPLTLVRWKQEPEVQAIARDALKILGGDKMTEVIKSLTKEAIDGNVQAMRLYMEWQGQIGTRKPTTLAQGFEVTFHTDKTNGD